MRMSKAVPLYPRREISSKRGRRRKTTVGNSRRDLLLFTALFLFRIVNALTIRTYFQPDEYWQSLEVANVLVYDYGYLTWEWRYGLRSILHPLLFAGVFYLNKVLGVDTATARVT